MKNKFIKLVVSSSLIIAFIPTSIFTYATTDIEYVEQVYSSVEIPELQLNTVENTEDNTEDKQVIGINDIIAQNENTEDSENTKIGLLIASTEDFPSLPVLDNNSYEDATYWNVMGNTRKMNIIEEWGTIDSPISKISKPEEEETMPEPEETVTTQEKEQKAVIVSNVDQSQALLEIDNPDENYTGTIVSLTPEDRSLLEHLVMGEAGGVDMEAAALVAQAIRDAIVYKGYNSVAEVRKGLSYSGSIKREPTQDVLDACAYIFDEGGIAVKHKIIYFYAPKRVSSSWHESQVFVVEYGGHRYFSPRK